MNTPKGLNRSESADCHPHPVPLRTIAMLCTLTHAMPDAIAHIACMLYVCLCGLCASFVSLSYLGPWRGFPLLALWAELCDTDSPSLHRMHRPPCTALAPACYPTLPSSWTTAVVLTGLRATAGSVVAGMAATENTVPETQRMPDKLGTVPFATPYRVCLRRLCVRCLLRGGWLGPPVVCWMRGSETASMPCVCIELSACVRVCA
jgi:hypothetical protein